MRFFIATFQSDADLAPYAQHSVVYAFGLALLVLMASIVMTHLTVRFIELPLQRKLHRSHHQKSTV